MKNHLEFLRQRKEKEQKKTETHIQCDSREEGEVNSKQKSDEVWHAISQLKEQLLKLSELVSGKTGTKTNNSDYEPSKRELLITSSNTENMSKVNNKGNIEKITYYFLVIDKDENEKELNKINKALELKSTISKLQRENARLNDQVPFLKQENLDLHQKLKDMNRERNCTYQCSESKSQGQKAMPDKPKPKRINNQDRTISKQNKSPIQPSFSKLQNQPQSQSSVPLKSKTRQLEKKASGQIERHVNGGDKHQYSGRAKETVIIAGDSMIRGQKGWMMSRSKTVNCKAFSGATCDDMEHYLNPILSRKPDHLILHIGTNDLHDSSPTEVVNKIKKLTDKITGSGINCFISSLIIRNDSEHLNQKVQSVNTLLSKLVSDKVHLITHDNITNSHLNRGGLHLSTRGDGALAHNFIQVIRNLSTTPQHI